MVEKLVDAINSDETTPYKNIFSKVIIIDSPLEYCPNHDNKVKLELKVESHREGNMNREYSMCDTCGYFFYFNKNEK